MKKIKYIAGAIVFLLFIIAYIVVTEESKKRQSLAPKPIIPDTIEEQLPITFSNELNNIKFPSSAPLLALSPSPFENDYINLISINLGFEAKPTTFKDIKEGVKYIWNENNSYLLITPNNSSIEYGKNYYRPPEVVNKQLGNESITQIASDFVINNVLIPEEQIRVASVDYYDINPNAEGFLKASKENAVLFQVNFAYSISDYEILTLIPDQPLIFVRILRDGSIYNAQIIFHKTVIPTKTKYSLKNLNDISNSLDDLILVSVINNYVNVPSLKINDISEVVIDSIELVYLLDKSQADTLHPVFLLEGDIKISGYSNTRAQFYLPAIKNP